MGTRRWYHRAAIAIAVAAASTVATPAVAACHIAAFEQTSVSVDESAGEVELTIFLQGRQPGCAGTVDWATEDGTAVAGEDYEASSGTVEFVADDDREETITIPILADDATDPDETFTVVLSNPQGLSGTGGPATVTITEGGAATGDPAPEPTEEPSEPDAVTTTDPEAVVDDEATGEASGTPWVPILVVVLVLGIGGALFAARGRSGPTG